MFTSDANARERCMEYCCLTLIVLVRGRVRDAPRCAGVRGRGFVRYSTIREVQEENWSSWWRSTNIVEAPRKPRTKKDGTGRALTINHFFFNCSEET